MNITKEIIIETFLNKDSGKIIAQRCSDTYLKNNGWHQPLLAYYNDSESCTETIYRIIYDIDIKPVCKICGKPIKFNHGFATYCSSICANKDPEIKEKIASNVSKSLKETYKKHGEEIKQKRTLTLKEHYNLEVKSPFEIQEIKDKAKETLQTRYNVNNCFNIESIRNKNTETSHYKSIKIRKEQGYNIEYIKDGCETKILVKNGCPIHGDIIVDLHTFNNRAKEERKNYTTMCLICNPLKSPETSIEASIKNLLNNFNISYIQHDRNQIKPYELDFYIPEYKLAIECNGIYWHSGEDNGKRLLRKQKLCADNGIRLIYFWEDEIHNKLNIIKSYLQSIFGLNQKIYARKCIIKEIDSKTSAEFINNNHLQGNINASIKLGLFYNDELVQIMTFGKLRKSLGTTSKVNQYELYRLCSLCGYTIVGGASKLLKYFINNYKPEEIITYCSNDISIGNVYEKIGFNHIKDCGVGYCYINRRTGERKNRFVLRKDKVDDNSGRTEVEINKSNGWEKCYNTGNKKFILKNIN